MSSEDFIDMLEGGEVTGSDRDLPRDNCSLSNATPERFSGRALGLRHPANHFLFRIRAMVVRAFRRTLESQGFMEIHTPKFQASAATGAGVFNIRNFGERSSQTQRPWAREMAIAADFQRVYEVGPVFYLKKSGSNEHLAEGIGLDLEMAFSYSYYELIQVVDGLLKAIFTSVQSMRGLQFFRQRQPSQDLAWPDKLPIVPFGNGLQMLREDSLDAEKKDLSAQDEKRLAQLVKERYKSDCYVLDRLPAHSRPFYIQKSVENPACTNSFDVFICGQRICTGGQRIHDPQELWASMRNTEITDDEVEEYLIGFDLGIPPHGGAKLDLDRLVAALLQLEDHY